MGSVKGSVYKRGNFWWIAYVDSSGKRHHESSESTKKTVAQEKLNSGLELVRKDQPIVPTKVRFKELLEDVANDYREPAEHAAEPGEIQIHEAGTTILHPGGMSERHLQQGAL